MADELTTTGVHLVLGSKGVSLDKAGRISFANPEVLQALVSARPAGSRALDDTNVAQCGCNTSSCGGHSIEAEVAQRATKRGG